MRNYDFIEVILFNMDYEYISFENEAFEDHLIFNGTKKKGQSIQSIANSLSEQYDCDIKEVKVVSYDNIDDGDSYKLKYIVICVTSDSDFKILKNQKWLHIDELITRECYSKKKVIEIKSKLENYYADHRIDLLNPYPFRKKNKRVYGKFVFTGDEDFESESIDIQISLINDDMIRYDQQMFDDISPEDSIRYINKDNKHRKIYRTYFYEFFAEGVNSHTIREYISFEEEKWYEFEFQDITEPSDEPIIEGDVIFGASPLVQGRGGLKVSGECILNIPFSKKNFEKHIKPTPYEGELTLLENVTIADPIDVKVYNVGQGNLNYIKYSSNASILFDVGFTKHKNDKNIRLIEKAVKEYSKLSPNMVVLSHWDLDHILGVINFSSKIYKGKWIVPNLYDLPVYARSMSALRLLAVLYLNETCDLYVIDKCLNKEKVLSSKNGRIEIWKGRGKSKGGLDMSGQPVKISQANNMGLIMVLKGQNTNERVLLAGDCEYSEMPSEVIKHPFSMITVPHHGSNMKAGPVTPLNNQSLAVISVGEKNSHNHPSNSHIDWLRNTSGFKRIVDTKNVVKIEYQL